MSAKYSFVLLPVVALTLLLLSGCGGGGGGSSSGGGTTNTSTGEVIVDGTETDTSGNPIVGVKVVDPADSVSTNTLAGGTFSLQIPAADTGTTVDLDFYNSSNQLLQVKPESITANSGQTQNIGIIAIGPPAPPANPGNKAS